MAARVGPGIAIAEPSVGDGGVRVDPRLSHAQRLATARALLGVANEWDTTGQHILAEIARHEAARPLLAAWGAEAGC